MCKKIALIIACLLHFSISVLAQNVLRDVDSPDIDILHYKINLRFDWVKKQAKGDVTISLLLTRPAQTLRLAANDLLIHSVYTADKKASDFKTDTLTKSVQLFLDRVYNAGDTLSITIAYETLHHNNSDPNALGGSFGKGIRFFQPTLVNPIKRKQLWSQSELQNTSYWLPCTNNISDVSSTEIIVTIDQGLTFITNGNLLEKKQNADGTVTFHYKDTIPYPAYLIAFAAGDYHDLIQTVNGTTLHTWCYPDEQQAATATTKRLPDMLQFLESKTAFNYPFKHYSQIMVQDYPFPSLTGQNTVSIISDNMIDDYGTHKDFLYLWDGVEFNALASQWFGNVIMPKHARDLWLSKGFAQYFEGLYTAERNGKDEYLLWYHPFETGTVFGDWNSNNRHPIVPEKIVDAESFAADSYSKYRAALILRMLQSELGEADFLKSVQHFIKQNAFKPATTEDFQNVIKYVTGNNLQWFFDQWIYKTGHPVFQFTHRYDAGTKQLHAKIRQIQETDTSAAYIKPEYFKGKIEIEIDDNVSVVELLPKAENEFSIPVSTAPKIVNLDHDNIWLRELTIAKSTEEWLYQFLHSKHALARSNAMKELVTFEKKETATSAQKNKIIRAFQSVIAGNDYWRFRFNVLGQLRAIQPLPYDKQTIELLTSLIKKETSWVKVAAITSLGMTNDAAFADLYIACFDDTSDRVVNAAAIALGKTKSPKAFDALVKLKDRPSWKSQSLMHCLNGFAQLNDVRAEDIALAALADNHSPRWFLGNGWDYPFVAVQTLAALGKTEKAYTLLLERFNTAMQENNSDDIFYQTLLLTTLANPKAMEIFERLKTKFSTDANAMTAIQAFEEQLKTMTTKK